MRIDDISTRVDFSIRFVDDEIPTDERLNELVRYVNMIKGGAYLPWVETTRIEKTYSGECLVQAVVWITFGMTEAKEFYRGWCYTKLYAAVDKWNGVENPNWYDDDEEEE